jgi:SGNH domain-containing protein
VRATRAIGALLGVVLVCTFTGAGAGARSTRTSTTIDPVLAARVGEDRALGAAPLLPTDRAPRVAFVGDSVAATLAIALTAETAARGIPMARSVRPGCGILRGEPTTFDGYTPPWASACDRAASEWRAEVARLPADVVLLLSTWDGAPRLLDGFFVNPATPDGRATMADLFREVVDAIAPVGSGRTVVLLAEAIPTQGATTGAASPARVAEARRHLAVLRTVARSDPARVRLIDLDRWLCPAGAPCPAIVGGVEARPEDGGHFSPEGAFWLAPKLLDAVGLTAR